MSTETQKQPPAKGNGRLVILAVFGAFLAPVLLAILMQSDFWSYQTTGSKSHGTLIKPVLALPELRKTIASRNKWWLVTLDDGHCGQSCEKSLIEMRQLRKAAGRHSGDIALLYVAAAEPDKAVREKIQSIAATIEQQSNANLYQRMIEFSNSQSPAGELWLLDRDLNLFMHYSAEHDPTGVRKDLKRLLTWAQEKPE